MNIKIDNETFNTMVKFQNGQHIVGSALYRTLTETSDRDYLIIVKPNEFCEFGKKYQHTITFDNDVNNIDHTIMDEETFLQKAKSGDDLVCFEAYYMSGGRDFDLPKVIRAYSGIANRDLKQAQKTGNTKKLYHAIRCQFIADELIFDDNVNIRQCAKDAKDIVEMENQKDLNSILPRIIRLRQILKNA